MNNEKITGGAKLPVWKPFMDDGRVLCKPKKEDVMLHFNTAMMCQNFKGVFVFGPALSGKTSLIMQFARQDLPKIFGVKSARVITLEEFTNYSEEELLNGCNQVCNQFEDEAIFIYIRPEDEKSLNAMLEFLKKHYAAIRKACKTTIIKFIFEYTASNEEDTNKLKPIKTMGFSMIFNGYAGCFDDKYDIFSATVKTLSKRYGISVSRKTIFLIMVLYKGFCDSAIDYYQEIEKLFTYTKNRKQKRITEKTIKKFYCKIFNYISETPEQELRKIAFHEAGHTLFKMIDQKYFKLNYVSIIPGKDYSGLTAFMDKAKASFSKKDYIYVMAGILAGRISENYLCMPQSALNKRARTDLKRAKGYANEIVHELGDSKSLGPNFVILNGDQVSERTSLYIENEKMELMQQATDLAMKMIFRHKAFVEKLADRLLKELYVSGNDVCKMWEKYLKEVEQQ